MKSVKSQVSTTAVPDVGRCRTLKLRYRSYDRPPKADKRLRTAPRDALRPASYDRPPKADKRLRTAPRDAHRERLRTPPLFSREIAVPASPGLPPALSDPRTLRTAPPGRTPAGAESACARRPWNAHWSACIHHPPRSDTSPSSSPRPPSPWRRPRPRWSPPAPTGHGSHGSPRTASTSLSRPSRKPSE